MPVIHNVGQEIDTSRVVTARLDTVHAAPMTIAAVNTGTDTMSQAGEFGALLRQLRKHKGLTQQQLADAIGTDIYTISLWERGARVPTRDASRDLVLRASQVLGDSDRRLMQLCGFAPRTDQRVIRDRTPFREFVLTVETLTTQQKQVVLAMYDSWVAGGG